MNTSQAIRERIAALPAREPFTPALFAGLGSRAAIDQALMRLTRKGHIERIGRGLYTVSRTSRFGLKAMPSAKAVVQMIADRDGASIEIDGAEAARRFGLSTQAPTQPVFYTTGPSHTLQMGKLKVRMKHVAGRKLALAGRPAGQALSALWYLGRQEVTPATFKQIATKLSPEEFEALCNAKESMPAWMVAALRQYEEGAETHD